MTKNRTKAPGKTRNRREPLGREIWLNTARRALIEEGTVGVQVNKLAKRLGATRGGFYWFFTNRKHLLDELLTYWVKTSTTQFERLLQTSGRNGMGEFQALIDLWIDEEEYDAKWDSAVRDWARTSTTVAKAVRRVDAKRVAVLEQVFYDLGHKGMEAHVRARVTYYHQVGYYALGVHESRKQRRTLVPFYRKVLTGRDA